MSAANWPRQEKLAAPSRLRTASFIVLPPPRSRALSAVYGPDDGRLYLVRPDGYIAFKCPAGDMAMMEAYLKDLLTI